ncbi:spore cortex biosynthesis protein YabQ [Paenibacillus sp. CMAA1364]
MNPHAQWITLLWMLFSGASMGLVYDSYRVLSIQFRCPKWTIHLMDFMYWCGMAIFIFRMLYISNQGELRFYVFIGLFLGVWCYFLILSVTTQRFVVMLIKVIQFVLRVIERLIMVTLWIPVRTLYRLVVAVIRVIWTVCVFIMGIVWRCLYPLWYVLKWISRPVLSKLDNQPWMKKIKRASVNLWNRWS